MTDQFPSDKARQHLREYFQERKTERVPPPRTPDPAELVKAELERYREEAYNLQAAARGVTWAIGCLRAFQQRAELEQVSDPEEFEDWVELLVDRSETLARKVGV